MRNAVGYNFKGVIAAALLSCFIAGGIAEMTSPSVAKNVEAPMISIDRSHKGDRLVQAPLSRQHQNNPTSPTATRVWPKQTPLGCDPAFSPVADPARAHIFMRCMT
jgi:hypothetical protein